jgi:hypothetical protein
MASQRLLRDLYAVGRPDGFREDAPVARDIIECCHECFSLFLIHLSEKPRD